MARHIGIVACSGEGAAGSRGCERPRDEEG